VPTHAAVETITFGDVGHLGLLVSRQVIAYIAAALSARESATAAGPSTRLLPSAS
jgi:hypothetical protein